MKLAPSLSLLSSPSPSGPSSSSLSLPASVVGTMHQPTAACRSRKLTTTTTTTTNTTIAAAAAAATITTTTTTTIATVDNNKATTAMHHRAGTGGAGRPGGCRRTAAAPSPHLAPSPPPPAAPMITTTTTPLPVPALLPATSPLASCGIELEQDTCHSARRRRGAVARPRHHCSATSTSSNLTTSNTTTTTTTKTAATDGSKSLRSVPWGPRGSLRFGLSTRSRLLPLLVLGLGLVNLLLPASPASAESLSDMALYYDQNSTSLLSGTSLLQLSNATFRNQTVAKKDPLFPDDLFTEEQRRNGAIILHIIGVIYMFVALAIVCDEFFVPSLDVIIEKLGITDDVAGATFMAAGGSAPELFTSIMGVFVSFNDVGIGTIVGSAVFNILFVIGMCALFSKTILSLTWWPLFRDCTFYSVSLLTLIYFFRDNKIYWWEALVLFIIYILYAVFMKFNQQVERCVKKIIYKNKVTRVRSTDQLMPAGNAANSSETSMATQPGGSVTSRAASESRSGPPGSSSGSVPIHQNPTATGAKFRHGLLQLMIHTIDPLHDDPVPGKVDEKATQLHAIASLKVLLDATKPQRGAATSSAANHVKINLKETTLASDRPNGNIDTTIDSGNELEEEPPEALSMSWPKGARKRITYLLVAPIIFPLYLTLPDTRTPRGKRFFPITFIGSIVWIAVYSYLMVWWATVVGETSRIPPEVMGLTFLAAGTSIPDLITSVIVARKGFGDMAVSSSVGSNIFDVTVGLPIPWLMYGMIYGQPVEVNSVGMVCSITILFLMLLFVVMSIACFRWRMNKGLGFTMFLLYFAFVAVSLMFEYDVIVCPF
uniref:sodium/potassium/calcium exchanger Nckx30C isoform X1 n=1 Tax=Anopheles coluzzii TaxID=1518534 RepID=UPI0020FF8374|nr:sodium/potassium/calcium exchanger Nckx30C isoform X1 [Anopheles coluzzii]XP_040231734.2 sodium/potassium/calcium exchanger Nckx30C isoform X1 [Anopheles coluzzii]XP_040231735.2 sodium/potassium/calcium exchanger Nckx30C isoform X1 [Anopheles coluzzii]XP_040231736.2 sodium/potassium/calcium exchanger Nckx30C isoform X1 [Anopheles coluzzii]